MYPEFEKCHSLLIRHSQQCTVCRQYMTCVWCGSCLSQFQIYVCVSGLVCLLSVSKFSLHQSVSTVTKSLSSSQSTKKRKQLCVHILNSHNNPALRYNRYFNIATAQRQREATFVLICFAWELPRTNCFSSVHFYAHCLQNNCHAPHGVWHQKDFDVTHTVELLSKERAWIKCCQIPTEAAESPSLT